MTFPPHGHQLDESESEALRLLIEEKRLDFYLLASKIGAGFTGNAKNYGVRMLNGKRPFSRPAWQRTMVILGITTRQFLQFLDQLQYSGRFSFEEDPNLAARVRLFGEYIALYDDICDNPTRRVVAVDTTGCSKQFKNWTSNEMYRGILQRNASFVRAFRKYHGMNGVAMRRNFIIEPSLMTEAGICNLEQTLKLHLERGIHPGVVYRRNNMPADVIGDIGILSGQYCIDAGLIEGFAGEESRLNQCVARHGQKQFNSFTDRVEWTNDSDNLVEAYCIDMIPEIIRDLRSRRQEHYAKQKNG